MAHFMHSIDTNCTRPVFFENQDPDFPFSRSGTAFFVSYNDRVYAVTAYHAVSKFHPRQYRLIRSLNDGKCFEYAQPFTPWTEKLELDLKCYDFVVIPLCHTIDEVSCDVLVWPLLSDQPLPSAGERLWIDGYPDAQCNIDYEKIDFEVQGGIVQCRIDNRNSKNGIFTLNVTSEHDLSTFSGFSGGPAYITPAQDGTMADTRVFGVTIQGSPESGLFHVIGIHAVKALIDVHLSDTQNPNNEHNRIGDTLCGSSLG